LPVLEIAYEAIPMAKAEEDIRVSRIEQKKIFIVIIFIGTNKKPLVIIGIRLLRLIKIP
jgi:hypothetical protein